MREKETRKGKMRKKKKKIEMFFHSFHFSPFFSYRNFSSSLSLFSFILSPLSSILSLSRVFLLSKQLRPLLNHLTIIHFLPSNFFLSFFNFFLLSPQFLPQSLFSEETSLPHLSSILIWIVCRLLVSLEDRESEENES